MAEHPLIGKVLAGDYKIISFLGKGGMGSVFVAEQPSLKRQVAIKILPSFDLAPEEIQRFEFEIASMATLSHPNIVTIHHRGKCNDPPALYYVMELLEGGSLKGYIERFGKIPPVLSLRLIRPVAEALAFAHEQGCIHRDIKPHNLLFTANYRSLKVADFGIAKLKAGRGITKSESMVGTFLYAAPEQMQWYEGEQDADVIDERADQYSLGVVLYEMISGKLPYQANNLIEMIKALSRPPIPVSQAAGYTIAKSLEWLITTMTSKSRANRFIHDEALLDACNSVELEIASSVSTRLFAIKSDEIPSGYAQATSNPTPYEKSVIQGMETQCSTPLSFFQILLGKCGIIWSIFKPRLSQRREDLPYRTIALITLGFLILGFILIRSLFKNNEEEDRDKTSTSSKITEILEKTHSNVAQKTTQNKVNLRIVPLYYPPTPAKYPKLQIFFTSPDGRWVRPVQMEDTIAPGTYNLSIILPGYECPDDGKPKEVRAGQLCHLTITLNAIPRSISQKIVNKTNGEEITPLDFKIDGMEVWEKRFRPGLHHFYALFEFYQEINVKEEIPPGENSFQYQSNLVPLKKHFFLLSTSACKNDGTFYELEAYVGQRKLNYVHLNYTREQEQLQGHVWLSPDTTDVKFQSGYQYTQVLVRELGLIHNLDQLDINRLLVHFKQIKTKEALNRELQLLWEKYHARIAALPVTSLGRLYQFFQEQTASADWEELQTPLWQWRRITNLSEREEHAVFEESFTKTQAFENFEDRVNLWLTFLKKYPQGIYHKKVQSLVEYNRKVLKYENEFKKSLEECILTVSEKRALKKLETGIRSPDIAIVKKRMSLHVQQLRCEKSLEEMLRD